MNGHRNLVISFIMSVALHGIVVVGVASLVMVGTFDLVPVFRQGMSSVMITIEQPSAPEVVPMSEVKKIVSLPVIRKEPKPASPKEESVKVVVPKPESVKPPVVKKEELKPVVAVQPAISEMIHEEAIDSVTDAMIYEQDIFSDVVDDMTEASVEHSVGKPVDGDKLDKGVQDFADAESFIDIRPSYPLGARLRGEEGVVVVRVTVSQSGRADNVQVMKSSGYSSLDESAINALKRARFVAKNGGTIHGGEVTLPFRFKLVN